METKQFFHHLGDFIHWHIDFVRLFYPCAIAKQILACTFPRGLALHHQVDLVLVQVQEQFDQVAVNKPALGQCSRLVLEVAPSKKVSIIFC